MNKFLFTIIALVISALATVQAEEHRIYAIFVIDADKTPPVLIQESTDSGNAWSGFKYKENYLRDENGQEIKFNNFLPALGYLQKLGWTIPDINEQIIRNMPTTVNGRSTFLIYKDASEAEWLQWIENGIKKK